MSMQSATRSLRDPLGGRSGSWRHRIFRFHVPLALASALILGVFMMLPLFDVTSYHGSVDISSGAFPQQRSETRSTDHGGDQAESADHGGGQTGSMDSDEGHGGNQAVSTDHGGGQAGSVDSEQEHGGGQAG